MQIICAHVWEYGPVDLVERGVLMAVAEFCDRSGFCWPSVARLVEVTCLSRATVFRVLRRLEDDGWLRREARTRANGARTASGFHVNLARLNVAPGRGQQNNPSQAETPPVSKRDGITPSHAETGSTLNKPIEGAGVSALALFDEWRRLPLNGKPPFDVWKLSRPGRSEAETKTATGEMGDACYG